MRWRDALRAPHFGGGGRFSFDFFNRASVPEGLFRSLSCRKRHPVERQNGPGPPELCQELVSPSRRVASDTPKKYFEPGQSVSGR